MSEGEDSGAYDSESRDLYQDRPTQGTLSGSSPIRQTRAKTYLHSARKGKDKGMRKGSECSEDDDVTLSKVRKPSRPLSPLIVQVNHQTRREDNPAYLFLSGPRCPNFSLYGMMKWGSTSRIVTRSFRRQRSTRVSIKYSIIYWCFF